MRVFIDANVYLNFFRPSEEELSSLTLLRKNLKKEKVNLIFPAVTQDELLRNLPIIRNKYINELRALKLSAPQYASVAKDKEQTRRIKKLVVQIKKELNTLEKMYMKKSDKLIKDDIDYLINNSLNPAIDDEVLKRAKKRRLVGNPPGKGDTAFHIGDEIVWETLLMKYTDDDLVIVSNDSDWKEPQADKNSREVISRVLEREWRKTSTTKLLLVATLGEFLNTYLRATKVSDQEIKAEESIKDSGADIFFSNNFIGPATSIIGNPAIASAATTISGVPSAANTNMWTTSISTGLTSMVWSCVQCGLMQQNDNQHCIRCGFQKSPSL